MEMEQGRMQEGIPLEWFLLALSEIYNCDIQVPSQRTVKGVISDKICLIQGKTH